MRGPHRIAAWCRWGLAALLLITAAAWVASARVLFRSAGPRCSAILDAGELCLYSEGLYHTWDREWPAVQVGSTFNWGHAWPQWSGPAYTHVGPDTVLAWNWRLTLPLWMPVALLAAMTALAWLLRRRAAPGHCRTCGYNLTGNVSGVCPECGTPTGAGPERERRVTLEPPPASGTPDRDEPPGG